jgi:YcaO-like protein with predicted kinase domain
VSEPVPTGGSPSGQALARVVSTEQTLARIRPLLARAGITRVANVTGLDHLGIPVVTVCRPNARSLAVSQGKGVDLTSAKASGVMESLELHHAERPSLPLRLGSYAELRRSGPVIDVARLPRLSVSRFHQDLPLLWAAGTELSSEEPRAVPFELVHANFTLPLPTGSGAFVMSTNGLASGNTLAEATGHALCEVIERDATALWYALPPERRRERRLDPGSVTDPACIELLQRIARAGLLIGIWETTTDIAVPAFNCTLLDRVAGFQGRLSAAGGMGCHPSPGVALSRALTEAAQSRLTYISGSREDATHEAYERGQDPTALARWVSELSELPRDTRRFGDVPATVHQTHAEQNTWLLARLSGAGLTEAVAIDLTLPDFELPVVRVIVPGLEHAHDAPGYQRGPRARAVG